MIATANSSKTLQPSYHRNQQYSIIALTNAAGTLVERYTYTAYGTLGIYAANGTVRTSSTYANRYTYTGREYDPDLKLYHFRARWYDPATGGFISRDPLGYVDGMSLYRGYFGLKQMDPTGELILKDPWWRKGLNKPGTERIGFDDKGRSIIRILGVGDLETARDWQSDGLWTGDCFVWDPENRIRIRVQCPGRVAPGGVRRGKVCAVVLLDHGGSPHSGWTEEAREIAPTDTLPRVSSRQQIIAFLKGRNCCSLYIIGHQGGDIGTRYGGPNSGGVTTYPDVNDPDKPVIILPTRDDEGISPEDSFESELRKLLNCDEGCVINLFSCGEDTIKHFLTRQKIADRTGCTVCGSAETVHAGTRTFVDLPIDSIPGPHPKKQWMPYCNDPAADRKK